MQRTLLALAAASIAVALSAAPADATFPGRNGPIVFEQDHQLYRVPANGGKRHRLLRVKGTTTFDPAVSPSGKVVAFWGDVPRHGYDILTYDFKHRKLRDLTAKVKACYGEKDPTWSPDGKRLAFQCYRLHGGIEIYTISNRGKKPKRITHTGSAYDPAWAPRGGKIAYIGGSAVRVVRAKGGGDRLLNDEAPGIGSVWESVDWSPNGKQLVAESLSNGIWPMSPSTGALGNEIAPGAALEPVFSPDGKRVAYVDMNGSSPDLYSVNLDGTGRRRLTHGGGKERSPSWVSK